MCACLGNAQVLQARPRDVGATCHSAPKAAMAGPLGGLSTLPCARHHTLCSLGPQPCHATICPPCPYLLPLLDPTRSWYCPASHVRSYGAGPHPLLQPGCGTARSHMCDPMVQAPPLCSKQVVVLPGLTCAILWCRPPPSAPSRLWYCPASHVRSYGAGPHPLLQAGCGIARPHMCDPMVQAPPLCSNQVVVLPSFLCAILLCRPPPSAPTRSWYCPALCARFCCTGSHPLLLPGRSAA